MGYFKIRHNGQATVELSVALVIVMALLIGSLKIFLWINERMVHRQTTYESDPSFGRVAAASTGAQSVTITDLDNRPEGDLRIPGEVIADESSYPKLNIFK